MVLPCLIPDGELSKIIAFVDFQEKAESVHMRYNRFRSSTSKKQQTRDSGKSAADIVRELKQAGSSLSPYREQSLKIHGLICAKCGREFENSDRHFLTVHHKDGNHRNNPPDGSNWENLCIHCHEDEEVLSIGV